MYIHMFLSILSTANPEIYTCLHTLSLHDALPISFAWNDRFCSRSRTSDASRSRYQGGDGKTDGGTHLAVVVARPHRGEQQRHGGAARRGARVDRPRGLSRRAGFPRSRRTDAPARRHDQGGARLGDGPYGRSEEHTSELQSLMRISYAVFCLKEKK